MVSACYTEESDGLWYALEVRILDPLERERRDLGGDGVGDRPARQNVSGFGNVRDPRRQIHRLPEDVKVAFDHRSGVDAGVRRERTFAAHGSRVPRRRTRVRRDPISGASRRPREA